MAPLILLCCLSVCLSVCLYVYLSVSQSVSQSMTQFGGDENLNKRRFLQMGLFLPVKSSVRCL